MPRFSGSFHDCRPSFQQTVYLIELFRPIRTAGSVGSRDDRARRSKTRNCILLTENIAVARNRRSLEDGIRQLKKTIVAELNP
jgi:hypothetical protein